MLVRKIRIMRFLAVLGASVLLLSACGSSSSNSASASPSTTTTAASASSSASNASCTTIWGPASSLINGKLPSGLPCAKAHPYKVAVLGGLNCPYCSSWHKAVVGELKTLGANVVLDLNAGGSASTQAAQMQEAIAKKPNGIIVFPVSPSAIVPSLLAAKSAGVDVEASNSPPVASALNDVIGYTGPANTQEGQIAAKILAKAMHDKGNVIAILGAAGTTPEVNRLKGFKEELAKIAPSMKILGTGVGNWEEAQSLSATASLLTRFGSKVGGIFAEDDTTAVGAAKAASAAGYSSLPIVGVGGSTAGLQAIKAGTVYGTMFQSPYMDGAFAPIMLYDQLEGLKHAHVVNLPLPIITKSNVSQFTPEW